jgi:hypothetical protein
MATSRGRGGSRAAGGGDRRHLARRLGTPRGVCVHASRVAGSSDPQDGDTFLAVFESNRINNRGDVLFGSNVTADQEGGLFLLSYGEISQIPARTGEGAPGGGVFSLGTLLPTPSNDKGDVGFIWLRDPFILPPEGPPIGVNGGLVPHPALGQTGSRLRHSSQAQGASWGQCAAASRRQEYHGLWGRPGVASPRPQRSPRRKWRGSSWGLLGCQSNVVALLVKSISP